MSSASTGPGIGIVTVVMMRGLSESLFTAIQTVTEAIPREATGVMIGPSLF